MATNGNVFRLDEVIIVNMIQGGTWQKKEDSPNKLVFDKRNYQIRSIKIAKHDQKIILYVEFGAKNNLKKFQIHCDRLGVYNIDHNEHSFYFYIQDRTVRVSPGRIWRFEAAENDNLNRLYVIIKENMQK